jgi:hypothetical protein
LPLESAVALPISVEPANSLTVLPAAAVPVKVGVVSLVTLSLFDDPESDAAVRSGVEGTDAPTMVTERAADAGLVLPAASVAIAVMLCAPWLRAGLVTVQGEFAVVLPIGVGPANRVTVLPASAAPVKVGVVVVVMLSLLEDPVSDAAVMSGAEGAAGAVVSIVIESAADAGLAVPDESVAVALMLRVP